MNLDNSVFMVEIKGLFYMVFGATAVMIPLGCIAVFRYLTSRGTLLFEQYTCTCGLSLFIW